MPDFDLKNAFLAQQEVLIRALTAGVHSHPEAIGDNTELHWIQMLQVFLPARYTVAKAFVADANGGLSEQQDVLIYDAQYSPILYSDPGAMYVPAESVYGAFEVKQQLTKGDIEYAGKKVASVRHLERTSAAIRHAGGEYEPKEHAPIIGGILAVSSSWSSGLGEHLVGAVTAALPEERLDLGCALKHGAFEVCVDAEEGLSLEVSGAEVSLISFALRLFGRLQQLGTVPAIDIRRYGSTVWD